jgi:hypothetical protein
MATKKITDLQLRSNVDDDVDLPVDDGIQTYRVTAPQLRDYIAGFLADSKDAMNYSIAASVSSSAMTIALKDAAGNTPSSASPVGIMFRHSTLATGKSTLVKVTAALSTVISSGSTAGHVSAKDEYLYVYGINNAGAGELAWSSTPFDEGVLQNTTAEGGAGAADSKTTLYSTTARTGVAIRLLARFKSNQTTAGTWAAVPIEISLPPFGGRTAVSEVLLRDGNGYGAVNTKIRRFSTVERNTGSAITYADSSNDGASLTINEDGLYIIERQDGVTSGSVWQGLSLNSAQLTTNIQSLTSQSAALGRCIAQASSNLLSILSIPVFLKVGDVVRAHDEASGSAFSGTGNIDCILRILKVG